MRGLRSTKAGFGVAALLFMLALGCSSGDDGAAPAAAADAEDGSEAAVEQYALAQQFDLSVAVTSTRFNETRRIPRTYSCTQDDISPPITWGDVPEGTVSIALMVDSDQFPGPLWGHWVLWGIPPDARGVAEAVPNTHEVPDIGPKARQGTNSGDKIGWSGPCPPPVGLGSQPGHGGGPIQVASRYFFRVYALDTDLSLASDATKWDLLRAMDGHVLVGGELVGEQVGSQVKCMDPFDSAAGKCNR